MNQEILDIFHETGALLEGHFKLTSGLHSPTYFQCAQVLQYPHYSTMLAGRIADHFRKHAIDVVISPAIGGIVVGQEVGRQLGKRTIFAERQDGVMQLRRNFMLSQQERVLVCEDVVTTGGSVFEVIKAVESIGAVVTGVGYIVDRSNGKVDFNTEHYSILNLEVIVFNADSCPLCAKGIPLNKPGSRYTVG
jgi:orotate phosphoribosyltransferase